MTLYGNSLINNLLLVIPTVSILVLVSCFHLFLYWFYSRGKSNLYISLFIFMLAGQDFTKFLPTYSNIDIETYMISNLLRVIFGGLWLPAMLIAYYSVLLEKIPRHVWLYFLWTFTWIYANIYGLPGIVIFIIMFTAFLDMMLAFIRSERQKKKFTWIIGAGVLLSQSALVLLFSPIQQHQISESLLLYIIFLSVPVAMTIFNSLRTAQTEQKMLEIELDEVKRLTEHSLAQEQEKQQILATQNERLEGQVAERTSELKQSLEELKSMQAQLIQSEKMASLGELTAGIAHEIQNPLNFVNNFSEINTELIAELKKKKQKRIKRKQ